MDKTLTQQLILKEKKAKELFAAGEIKKATELYEQILEMDPENFDASVFLGMQAVQDRNWTKAHAILQVAVKNEPNNALLIHTIGYILKELKLFDKALINYDLAIEIKKDFFYAYYNKGILLFELKKYKEALTSYDKAIQINKNFYQAFANRGIVLVELNKVEAAIASYEKAISINNEYTEAYYNLGVALLKINEPGRALHYFEKAINQNPKYTEAYNNIGIALINLKRFEEALKSFDISINLNQESAEIHNNRGLALQKLGRVKESLEAYGTALKINPLYPDAYFNKGNALKELRLIDEAINNYKKAIDINPVYAQSYYNCAVAMLEKKLLSESINYFENAVKFKPDIPFILGDLFHAKMLACDWNNYANILKNLNAGVLNNKLVANPFGFQGVCDNPKLLQKAANLYSSYKFPSKKLESSHNKIIQKNKKIKVGYLCGEFREQATSILMVNLWEKHSKDKFEIYAFDNGWDDGSEIRKRIENAFENLFDISGLSDIEVVKLIKNSNIDILINLNGFFGLHRNNVFSYKPAPIQINYLGFPGTMGVDYMDYIMADETVIPQSHINFYAEKVIYLPNCYQSNDSNRPISKKMYTKNMEFLPEDSFIFCCFNNSYKITPETFDSWMRILKRVDRSILWLLDNNQSAKFNLRKEALIRGVNPERLVFAKNIKSSDHLARLKLADLFLDTLPYNAHTTASDALWAEVPLLTRLGESFAGRVASSLLKSLELNELITSSKEEYESVAIELAINPAKLQAIKRKLTNNRLTKPLFNIEKFTERYENALIEVNSKYYEGINPEHLFV